MKINNRTHPGLNKILSDNSNLKIYAYSQTIVETVLKPNVSNRLNVLISEFHRKANNDLEFSVLEMDHILMGIHVFPNIIIGYRGNDEIGVFDVNGKPLSHLALDPKMQDYYVFFLTVFCFFKKYAEIETKLLPPKTESNDGFKCVYSNHSKYPITFINSTWFTNLVKSDAFKVSGHFRLQPCHDENGMPTKKLIWISDYIKSGYTAPARKLNHE